VTLTQPDETRTEPASAPAAHRRLDVQGLRAIAVILVVAFHAGLPVPGGFVGVDVFFVISGFVITAMLAREWAATGRIAFGTFYKRRFQRLTPALSLLVVVVVLASFLLQNPFGAQQTTARTGIGAVLLSANFVIAHASGDYFAATATTNPLLHTWSLSVEEQFYLVFPALLLLGWALSRRRRGGAAPLIVVGLLAAASFALSLAWSFGVDVAPALTSFFGGPESIGYYSSLTRGWEFAAGAVLALVLPRVPVLRPRWSWVTGMVGAALLVAAAFAVRSTDPFPGFAALLPVAGTVLLILGGSHRVVGVNRFLSARPMVWVGDLSYSWYLWHWPLIVFAALLFPHQPWVLVTAAAASLLPALASYLWVESPLRRMRTTKAQFSAVVVPTVGIPLALAVGLLMGANTGWGMTPPAPPPLAQTPVSATAPSATPSSAAGSTGSPAASANTTTTTPDAVVNAAADGDVMGGEGGSLRAQHAVVNHNCVNTDLDPVGCRFGTGTAGTILLAGDSQAYAVGDGLIAAADSAGYDVVATSHTGCPFLARESSGGHNYPCRAWQQDVLAWALKERPAAVVIANLSGGYVHPETGWRTAQTDSGQRATTVAEAADAYRAGLQPVVRELSDAGIPVILLASVPQMTGYTNRTSMLSIGSAFEVSRADVEKARAPALEVEQSLAAQYDGVQSLDPDPALCEEDICSTERDGEPTYQDETHVSLVGSLLLSDTFGQALTTALAH
jgi:peptidoglycan/LPS O-acetylase OafA/YrhL